MNNGSALPIALLALTLAACNHETQHSAGSPSGTTRTAVPPAGNAPELQAGSRAELSSLLAAYESVRDHLANDRTAGVVQAAGEMQRLSQSAAEKEPRLRERVAAVATSAKKLSEQPEGDIAKLRGAFGDVSRDVVALLAAEPALAEGKRVFECPMVTTYKKWVQTSEGIANPYMGGSMLTCGVASDFKS